MTAQNRNLELALELYRSIDAQNIDRLRQLVSPGCRSVMGGKVLDFQAWLGMGRMFMTAFPDGRHTFDLSEATGDYVLLHGTFTGTHTQEFQGLPATGRAIKISLTTIDKFSDGKLIEHYGDFDTGGLMQQLAQ